ncbi:MAG: class I SAM-dependent methyltransferase [Halanaerobiales bacterium]
MEISGRVRDIMSEVEKHYDRNPENEWQRLERHRIEFDITKRYLGEYIKNTSKILDVGGGPGRYSIHLARQRHEVTLLDLSSGNIHLAREKARDANVNIRDYIHANALELSEKVVGEFDVVLCMGPLYHLIEVRDRIKVIDECIKKLKKGGLFFAAFISAFAPIIDFIKNYPEEIINFKPNLLKYLEDGRNIVSEENPGFTDAYFIKPDEIEDFMDNFDLEKKIITGLEGLPAQSEAKINSLSEEAYQGWLDLVYQTSRNPLTWASSEHFLYIGKKK